MAAKGRAAAAKGRAAGAKSRKGKGKSARGVARRLSLASSLALAALLAIWGAAGDWFVHHPRRWIEARLAEWPSVVAEPLLWIGEPLGDLTDALGLTGHDAVYEYDESAPVGEVLFAGAPRRTGPPAPADIVILDRGAFKVGWSPSLRHPVWVAYHVPKEARHPSGKRPNFAKDRAVPSSPPSGSYSGSSFDRGHMAPNYAIATRFGPDAQRTTFLMSNISPQSAALNRGVWREVEHRIADLWTARYGEIWVVVGCIPSARGETIPGTGIDIPSAFWQVVVAQEGLDVRALAVVYDQDVAWGAWPTRGLVSIDELEEMTGLDFLPDLPDFIQSPLEAELPSRLWPVRTVDALRQIWLRFTRGDAAL